MVSFAPTRTQLVTLHLHPHLSHSLDDCWGDRPCNPSPPYTVPCRIVWASPADLSTYPNHFNLHFFTVVKVLLWDPMACLILHVTASLVMWFLYEMPTVSKASHLRGLQFLLDVHDQWPGFAGVQECRDNQGAHDAGGSLRFWTGGQLSLTPGQRISKARSALPARGVRGHAPPENF